MWLEKVLWGFSVQDFKDFELIIADDGSEDETKALIERMQEELWYPIKHVWHPHNGFQKTKILNKALLACEADYVLMTDGDCIPRKDFVAKHIELRKPNRFLSGGYHKLPMDVSHLIGKEDILNQRCFDRNWLIAHGMSKSFKNNKLDSYNCKSKFLNFITPTKATWNGHNSSAWLKDILDVNGFDERMQYGGLDRELGERLENKKIRGLQIRYSTTCVHLDHPRGYKNEATLAVNRKIRNTTKAEKRTWTDYGIVKKDL